MHVKKLLQKGFWTLSARVLGAGLTFIMTVLFARWLGAGDFGIFSLGLVLMTILGVITRWGTDQVLLKQLGGNREKKISLAKAYAVSSIKLVLILGVLASILIGVFHDSIASVIFNKPKLSEVLLYVGVLMVPFVINFTLGEVFKGMGRPVLASYVQNVITPLVAICLGYVVFNIGMGFGLLDSFVVFGAGVIASLSFSLFFWYKIWPSIKVVKVELKQLFKEGRPMLLISSAGLVMAWSDMIILGVWGSAEELGVYSAASKVVLVTSLILVAMNSITAPKYAELYQRADIKGLVRLANNSSKILFSLVFVPTIILFLFPEKILGLFGHEFVVGATILMVLTVGQFIHVACGSVGYLLTMTGNELKMRNIIFFTAIVNITLSIILVKSYGVIGVAIGTAFSIILWNVLALLEVKKQLGFWNVPFNSDKEC